MTKRVYCLYRVSTKGQVEKDDIPMQKQKCHEFAQEMGWDIVREFSEKGVSGFKVSAKDRDAIQEIQRDAAMGKFDVLLVFMFDRLGRKEDETPFVVEWFAQNGIEVWSTVEGQQRFDSHVDKLMNYIRYWQASGESLKTSIRTKTRLGQIVQEGRFRGGAAPYGYRLVKKGRIGKKNKELFDIEVNPDEAPAIRKMFELADLYGYGGRKISTELAKEGIKNLRTEEPFHYATIQRILQNIMYMGILRSGDTKSEIFPELQIIPPDRFERVERSRKQRSVEYMEKCAVYETITLDDGNEMVAARTLRCPRKNTGRALLSGNVYCGHCGGRIFASTARKSHHASKTVNERVPIYKCYNRTQHKELCNGPSTYRAQKVDEVIEALLRDIFSKAKGISEHELIETQISNSVTEAQRQLKKAKADLIKGQKELSRWEDMMLDSMDGKCPFTPEQVRKRMDACGTIIQEQTEKVHSMEKELVETAALAAEIKEQHKRLLSWADIFETASPEEKKMIASYMIKAVTISRDYNLKVDFNISEAQYLDGMSMG